MREDWNALSDRERIGSVVLIALILLLFVPSLGSNVAGPGRYSEWVTQVTMVAMVAFAVFDYALPSTPKWFRYVPVAVMAAWFVGGRVVSMWAFDVNPFASLSRLAVEVVLWLGWGWIIWRTLRRLRSADPKKTTSDSAPSRPPAN
jgi:hypothetical protein